MTVALVMAGGRGARMRASGASRVKPLVRVRGVPLLERNLTRLLSAGFRDLAVSLSRATLESDQPVTSVVLRALAALPGS